MRAVGQFAIQRGEHHTNIWCAPREYTMCSDFGLFSAVGGEVAYVKREWWLRFYIGKCTHSIFVCLLQSQNFHTAYT